MNVLLICPFAVLHPSIHRVHCLLTVYNLWFSLTTVHQYWCIGQDQSASLASVDLVSLLCTLCPWGCDPLLPIRPHSLIDYRFSNSLTKCQDSWTEITEEECTNFRPKIIATAVFLLPFFDNNNFIQQPVPPTQNPVIHPTPRRNVPLLVCDNTSSTD